MAAMRIRAVTRYGVGTHDEETPGLADFGLQGQLLHVVKVVGEGGDVNGPIR